MFTTARKTRAIRPREQLVSGTLTNNAELLIKLKAETKPRHPVTRKAPFGTEECEM